MEKTTFFVFKDHTLGYVEGSTDKNPMRLWILAVNYMKGGDPMLLGNCILVSKKDTRLASRSDFQSFRVRCEGYESDPRYVFDKEK